MGCVLERTRYCGRDLVGVLPIEIQYHTVRCHPSFSFVEGGAKDEFLASQRERD